VSEIDVNIETEIASDDELVEVVLPLLVETRDPLPEVVEESAALASAVSALTNGTGPLAIDAERASGFRYSARAYLIQLRRSGVGTFLIDPIGISNFSDLVQPLNEPKWILHSATQDLTCLREVGLVPKDLFDTEVAAKLLGKEKVGLAGLIESELGFRLAKEHSAADWSTRPLPAEWLNYAALDVELLIELHDIQMEQLDVAGRMEWAREEFAYLVNWQKPELKAEPWRKTSGLHQIKAPRSLAVVQALWQARDEIAQERDKAPGRIFSDAAIIDVAKLELKTARDVYMLPTLRNRAHKAHADLIWHVRNEAMKLPETALPGRGPRIQSTPPPKNWAEKYPTANIRWQLIRPALNELAEGLEISAEVLISPDPVRQLCFAPEDSLLSEAGTVEFLKKLAVRNWQINLVAPTILQAVSGLSATERSFTEK
jgi:ribonuclease D